ncbi:hypothetical protein ILUMI_14806, partial [Ignelater luminosus]
MEITGEIRNGLNSQLTFKCNMCNLIQQVSTIPDPEFINDSIVVGAMSVGSGYTHLKQIMSAINVPIFAQSTYDKIHNKVCDAWEETTMEEMFKAAEEEKLLAVAAGDVSEDGVPLITVVCDGVWAKRSYRCNFSSLSGAAAIVGYRTKKVLYRA